MYLGTYLTVLCFSRSFFVLYTFCTLVSCLAHYPYSEKVVFVCFADNTYCVQIKSNWVRFLPHQRLCESPMPIASSKIMQLSVTGVFSCFHVMMSASRLKVVPVEYVWQYLTAYYYFFRPLIIASEALCHYSISTLRFGTTHQLVLQYQMNPQWPQCQ